MAPLTSVNGITVSHSTEEVVGDYSLHYEFTKSSLITQTAIKLQNFVCNWFLLVIHT